MAGKAIWATLKKYRNGVRQTLITFFAKALKDIS